MSFQQSCFLFRLYFFSSGTWALHITHINTNVGTCVKSAEKDDRIMSYKMPTGPIGIELFNNCHFFIFEELKSKEILLVDILVKN